MDSLALRVVIATAIFLACGDGDAGEDPAPIERAPYVVKAFAKTRISSREEEPNTRRATASIDLGKGPFEKATMIVELESPCFPFEKWKQPGAIPQGQFFPEHCDAFDRTFGFHLLPRGEGEEKLDLVRAITPFGGPMHFEVDVTDIANGLPGRHDLDVTIDAWPDPQGRITGSRGSWFVSSRFEMVPGVPPRKVLAVQSIVNTSWSENGEDKAFGPFTIRIPDGTTKGKIEFRATGHGGGEFVGDGACRGPSEEFCVRTHSLHLLDRVVESFTPWQTCDEGCTVVDVADDPDAPFAYCLENPCANHESARAPRANWCPGKVTEPKVFEHAYLNHPGEMDATWLINRIGEGGSWRVSATYFAYGD